MNIIKLIKKEPCFYLCKKKTWRFSGGVKIKVIECVYFKYISNILICHSPNIYWKTYKSNTALKE